MTIRRVLIIAPILVVLILLQSYFWVPTYEQQTRGNPNRLSEFIAGSIGDASLLNPILSMDSASSQIEGMVFEGLVDRDENLRIRSRLATSWEVFEEAFFYINESADIPGLGESDPKRIADFLKEAKEKSHRFIPQLQASLDRIAEISVIPPRRFQVSRYHRTKSREQGEAPITFDVEAPARIQLVLSQVDPDFFQNLIFLFGKDYFDTFQGKKYIHPDFPIGEKELAAFADELLPATEHNPVLVFHLRPDVKFHDGHVFDAGDVKFTYESIMNPGNLSPRVSDYEPVKSVEIIDPLTFRVVYKRLFSPAVISWGMGILPEHLLNREALEKEALRFGKDPETYTMRQSTFNRRPIGCGPFKFREWKSDRHIILDRFYDYWEGAPNYEKFVFRVIPDLLTQEMEFYAGTIDNYGVQPYQVKRLEKDLRFQNFSGLSFGYSYIGYNMRRRPFDDLRVRRALGMAIDVNKIIDYVLYGQGERITGPFVKQTDYYNQGIRPLPYDPQGALSLLAEAGWQRNKNGWLEKNGKKFQFTLITNSGNDLRKAVLAIAQDAWKQIGIDVRTDILEWSVFIRERVNKLDFDAVVLGWQMGSIRIFIRYGTRVRRIRSS
ncbi:MAG TPA: ABC transporter substrate-binding protein [Desulfobacterales bacterium]|nr:ABC transporter substrate-binding protein [Desulfobacterales bacterium]